jgi:hypothetical protein
MEKGKGNYSPWTQSILRCTAQGTARPSCIAQAIGLRQPMPTGVRPECMHHAPVRGHRGWAWHLVRLPSAKQRWTLGTGGKEMIYMAQPLPHYTRTHSRRLGRGSSLAEWSGWWKPDGDKEKLGVWRTEGLETPLFCCMGQEGDMRRCNTLIFIRI